jgi:osmotically-inducible protein OsmY
MKTDADVRRDVESELRSDPCVDDTRIGVTVSNGVVALTGDVPNDSDRRAADDFVKRVGGAHAVVNGVQVKTPLSGVRTDTDIAEAAVSALQWDISLSHAEIKPVVKDEWVTLSGHVSWGYQRVAAENAVRSLAGVKGVTNDIRMAFNIVASNVKQKI